MYALKNTAKVSELKICNMNYICIDYVEKLFIEMYVSETPKTNAEYKNYYLLTILIQYWFHFCRLRKSIVSLQNTFIGALVSYCVHRVVRINWVYILLCIQKEAHNLSTPMNNKWVWYIGNNKSNNNHPENYLPMYYDLPRYHKISFHILYLNVNCHYYMICFYL